MRSWARGCIGIYKSIPTLFPTDDQARIRTVLETVSKRYFFSITGAKPVQNDHAIQFTAAKDRAILAKAKKAKGEGITGPTYDRPARKGRVEQVEQRESVHEEGRPVPPSGSTGPMMI